MAAAVIHLHPCGRAAKWLDRVAVKISDPTQIDLLRSLIEEALGADAADAEPAAEHYLRALSFLVDAETLAKARIRHARSASRRPACSRHVERDRSTSSRCGLRRRRSGNRQTRHAGRAIPEPTRHRQRGRPGPSTALACDADRHAASDQRDAASFRLSRSRLGSGRSRAGRRRRRVSSRPSLPRSSIWRREQPNRPATGPVRRCRVGPGPHAPRRGLSARGCRCVR